MSQDLYTDDKTFTKWQEQLDAFAEKNTCLDSILLEFLSPGWMYVSRHQNNTTSDL